MRGARLNKNYLLKNKTAKTKRCKICRKALHLENKSGLCSMHSDIENSRKFMQNKKTVAIDRHLIERFKEYCDKYGFAKTKKLEMIIKEILDKEDV